MHREVGNIRNTEFGEDLLQEALISLGALPALPHFPVIAIYKKEHYYVGQAIVILPDLLPVQAGWWEVIGQE